MRDWAAHLKPRLATLRLTGQAEAAIVDELGEHLEQRYQELRAVGESEADAERMAVEELLGAHVLAERLGMLRLSGGNRSFPSRPRPHRWFGDVWRDARHAVRILRARPLLTLTATLTLAFGIGLNTTVFSLFNGVLLKPVPVPNGDRLAVVVEYLHDSDEPLTVSYPDYLDMRAGNTTFAALEASAASPAIVSDADIAPERYRRSRVTAGIFPMIGAAPILGRALTPDDERPGAAPVVLLGYDLWRNRYQAAPDVIGRTVFVDGTAAAIVGVMPEHFAFPVREDFWMALAPSDAERNGRTTRFIMPVGVLKPDVPLSSASADIGAIVRRIAALPDGSRDLSAGALTFQQRFNGNSIERVFTLMMGAAAFVLLVACANVANLMLGQALERAREVSVRAALGASRWRIVRQLLVESVLLSAVGGLGGLAVAWGGVRAFGAASSTVPDKPYWIDFTMDANVFIYFSAVSILTGIVFGLVPAVHSARADLAASMRKDTARAGSTPLAARLSSMLVIGQFSLAVVLLAGAGLFVRSAVLAQRINPFVPYDHILAATVELPGSRYPNTEARRRFWSALDERLTAIPGVEHAALAGSLPGRGAGARHVEIEGTRDRPWHDFPSTWFLPVSPNYFSVIDLGMMSGRTFDERDGLPGAASAIVAQDFAERFWPNENPIGRRLRFRWESGPGQWLTVVGVAGPIDQSPMSRMPLPLVYIPTRADNSSAMRVLLRTSGDPTTLARGLRAEVRALDDTLALFAVATARAELDTSYWFLRLFSVVFSVFAGFGLLMAAAGIYAVLAQHTTRRTREIGVRMALGATSRQILRMILSIGARQLVIGLAVGLVGAVAITRLMTDLLLGISPNDPIVFTAVPAVLLAVGLLACWLPARRAAALPPTEALRED